MQKTRLTMVLMVVVAMAAGFVARTYTGNHFADPYPGRASGKAWGRASAYAPNTPPSDVGARSDVDLRPLEIFYSALQHLRDDYVEPIQKPQERDLAYSSVRTMLDSLHDPLTRFLDSDQAQLVQDARAGKFYGTGLVTAVRQKTEGGMTEEQLIVVTALPGSPARAAGLQTGDIITAVDGKTVLPYDPFQPIEKLIKASRNGQIDKEKIPKLFEAENERIKNGIGFQKASDILSAKGSKEFTLTISRAGAKEPLKIKVASAATAVDSMSKSIMDHAVGYVHINLMVKNVESQFAEAITDFKKKGVKGIVLDLRDCPGGSIETAQAIAGELIPRMTLSVLAMPRGKQRTLKADAAAETGAWQGPVDVLVNRGTSGVSEVLAAALRDVGGAKLVGSATFGNSMQQTLIPLRDGSAVMITTGKYLTPKGVDYKGKGISSDVKVAAGNGKSGDDPQLAKAAELLAAGKAKG